MATSWEDGCLFKETKKILEKNKKDMSEILSSNGFAETFLSDVSNYIFDRKF